MKILNKFGDRGFQVSVSLTLRIMVALMAISVQREEIWMRILIPIAMGFYVFIGIEDYVKFHSRKNSDGVFYKEVGKPTPIDK